MDNKSAVAFPKKGALPFFYIRKYFFKNLKIFFQNTGTFFVFRFVLYMDRKKNILTGRKSN